MDYSKQLATLGTHGTGRRQPKQDTHYSKQKRWATPTPPKTWVTPGARKFFPEVGVVKMMYASLTDEVSIRKLHSHLLTNHIMLSKGNEHIMHKNIVTSNIMLP